MFFTSSHVLIKIEGGDLILIHIKGIEVEKEVWYPLCLVCTKGHTTSPGSTVYKTNSLFGLKSGFRASLGDIERNLHFAADLLQGLITFPVKTTLSSCENDPFLHNDVKLMGEDDVPGVEYGAEEMWGCLQLRKEPFRHNPADPGETDTAPLENYVLIGSLQGNIYLSNLLK